MRIKVSDPNKTRSSDVNAAALPNSNCCNPADPPPPSFWIDVKSKIPVPKKTDNTNAVAVSGFIFETLDIYSEIQTDKNPEIKAPIRRTSGFLLPLSINAMTTPGKTECAIVSPCKARFRRNAKHPTNPELKPIKIVPATTVRTLESLKLKKSYRISITTKVKIMYNSSYLKQFLVEPKNWIE